MKRRPLSVSAIAILFYLACAGYSALLFVWLFARGSAVAFIEGATPSASLAPALLLEIPLVVTCYFLALAAFCGALALGLWKLQRWSWFVTCGLAALWFVLSVGRLAHLFRHLSPNILALGLLRLGILLAIFAVLNRPAVRRAFFSARSTAAAQG